MFRYLICAVLALSVSVGGAEAWAQDGPAGRQTPILRHQSTYSPGDGANETAGPAAVIGEDERIQFTETTEFPFSAIAWLGLYDSSAQLAGSCTGTFIGPDTLITAGHCLYSLADGYASDVVVVPGKSGGDEPFGSQFAYDIWVPPEWLASEDEFFDYGVISMPDSTLGDDVGWMPVAQFLTSTLERADFQPAIIGYPADKPDGTMWGEYVLSFDSVGPALLNYSIDTFAGQSGSAIFSINTTEYFGGFIAGIHVRATGTNNEGTRVDDILLSDLTAACEEIICTVDTFFETDEPTPTIGPGLQLIWGDPDCSGAVSFIDALKDLKFDAGLGVSQTVPDCPDFGEQVAVDGIQRRWADTDCDNDIDPIDGLKTLRADAGLTVNQPIAGCPQFKQTVTLSS